MRYVSDKRKEKEGRCLGDGTSYVPWIKAREARSTGTAVSLLDPIDKRKVELLSQGEADLFWILRFDDSVKEIKEQLILAPDVVNDICEDFGFRRRSRILTTDILAEYINGKITAYSVKAKRTDVFGSGGKIKRSVLERQKIEQEYWKRHGADFRLVFREDINRKYSKNVENVMAFYDPQSVTSEEDMLKYLVAHKIIRVDMEHGAVPYAKLVKDYPDIKTIFSKVKDMEGGETDEDKS